MPGDVTVPRVDVWLQVAPGTGQRTWDTLDPHSPLPLWLHIPLGSNAALGLGCCLYDGDEREVTARVTARVTAVWSSASSSRWPRNPPHPAAHLPCPAPADERWQTSGGNEALCPLLEKAPAAAGRGCCAQPLPRSPPGLSPPCALKPTMPPHKGENSPFSSKLLLSEGRALGKKKNSCNNNPDPEPSNLKATCPPAACARRWGGATTSGDTQSCCPPAPRLQCGRSAHRRGMQGWRRTRASSSCRHNVRPSVCSSKGRAGTRMLCQQLQAGALSL